VPAIQSRSPAFSFHRLLVPHLMGYEGWAISWTATCLCRTDIAALLGLRETIVSPFSACSTTRSDGNREVSGGKWQKRPIQKVTGAAECCSTVGGRCTALTTPATSKPASGLNCIASTGWQATMRFGALPNRLDIWWPVQAGPGSLEKDLSRPVPICCIGPSGGPVSARTRAMGGPLAAEMVRATPNDPWPLGLSECSQATQAWLVSTAGSARDPRPELERRCRFVGFTAAAPWLLRHQSPSQVSLVGLLLLEILRPHVPGPRTF